MKIKFDRLKKLKEDAIESKTTFEKWIKIKQIYIKKGQNQNKNNLKD
jgi:hypothetical protein